MSATREKYACDACRSRKIGCSRQTAGCQRCRDDAIACLYSRTGVLRRSRKRKDDTLRNTPSGTIRRQALPLPARQSAAPEESRPLLALRRRSALDQDEAEAEAHANANANISTHERLQILLGRRHSALKELAVLVEDFSTAWNGASACASLCKGAASQYYVFDRNQTLAWMDALASSLRRENLLLDAVPPDVADHLVGSRPQDVQDRAWLIMFYSIALNLSANTSSSSLSSSSPNNRNNNPNSSNASTKAKLTSNLWLAYNDMRLLLEPSATTIQALYTMACYAEAIATPALTWSLLHQAGTMFLALAGGAPRFAWRLDPASKQRRARMFWRLNVLDKAMALVLFRPPMFSRDMVEDVPMPTVDQLVPPIGPAASSRSDAESSGAMLVPKADNGGGATPTVFTAHFHNQMHLLSGLMADVWRCLHARIAESASSIKAELESWHRQAVQVLEAAALVEKPLLAQQDAVSIDIGLQTIQFYYEYLSSFVRVFDCAANWRQQGSSSRFQPRQNSYPQQLIKTLPSLEAALAAHAYRKPFGCMLWVYAGNLMTAFRMLWVEAASTGNNTGAESDAAAAVTPAATGSLEALDKLVSFFGVLRERNALLAEMEVHMARIALVVRKMAQDDDQTSKTENESARDFIPSTAHEAPSKHAQQVGAEPAAAATAIETTSSTLFADFSAAASCRLDMRGEGMLPWGEDLTDGSYDWMAWFMQEPSLPMGR